MAGNNDEVYDKSLNVTRKITKQYLIVRSDKSVAYVTNNNRLRSTFCTIEVGLLQVRQEVSRGLVATAELLVLVHWDRGHFRYVW